MVFTFYNLRSTKVSNYMALEKIARVLSYLKPMTYDPRCKLIASQILRLNEQRLKNDDLKDRIYVVRLTTCDLRLRTTSYDPS